MQLILQKSNKNKWIYSGYGVVFDGKGSWNFDNDFARKSIILVLIVVYNLILIILRITSILVESPTFDSNGKFGSPESCLIFILVKQTQSFA